MDYITEFAKAKNKATTPTSEVHSAMKQEVHCHSQPLSMMEYVESSSSNLISLAEHASRYANIRSCSSGT
ncbi:hypothetical protein P8452_45885 [Trifolium repens]|nr:hypothetical protein P8452_45885 [Trifolium repens]